MGDAFDSKDRKLIDLIVIAGVITKRTFVCHFIRVNHALEDKFCRSGYLQIITNTFNDFGFIATEQACEGIL